MSDLSDESVQTLSKKFTDLAGAMGKLMAAVEKDTTETRKSADQLREEQRAKRSASVGKYNNMASNYTKELLGITRDFGTAKMLIQRSIQGFVGGGVIAALMEAGEGVLENYRSMSDLGQNFGGSMLEMQKAAAASGLSLNDFAKSVSQNSEVVASMGVPSFMKLNRAVLDGAEAHGMYGMSLDQLGEYTGEYMKTARLWGDIEHVNRQQASRDIISLAGETSALAKVTGKSRIEIMKETQERMRSATIIARGMMMENGQRTAAMKQMSSSIAIMAAQFGESGNYLSGLLAETIGAGAAEITESGKTLIDAGMGQLTSAMNDVAQGRMSEIEYIAMFKDEVEANAESLRMQAAAGNQNAAKVLEYASQIKKMTQADIDRAKREAENAEKLTKLWNNVESVMGKVTGAFKEGFLKAVEPFMDSLSKVASDDGLGGLIPLARDLGARFGEFLSGAFSERNMSVFAATFSNIISIAGALGGGLMSLAAIATGPIGAAIGSGLALFSGLIWAITKPLAMLAEAFPRGASVFVAATAGFLMLLKAKNAISRLMGGDKNIRANVVNVFGGDGSGGGLGDMMDGGGGGKKWGKGRFGALGRKLGGKVGLGKFGGKLGGLLGAGAEMAGGAGRIGGALGMLGKVGKFIPGIGLVMGGMDAIDRFGKGDYLGGAISGLGAASSLLGPIGSLVGGGIAAAANAYLDSNKPNDPTAESGDPEAKLAEERAKEQRQSEKTTADQLAELTSAVREGNDIAAIQGNRAANNLSNMSRNLNTMAQTEY